MTHITQILHRIETGDSAASEELLPLVYDELRKLAAVRMASERPDHTLQATALVHEAYVRLVDVKQAQRWDSRGHFFAAAAKAIRRILVENARRKRQVERGGDRQRVPLEVGEIGLAGPVDELIALDEALGRLAEHDPQAAEIVNLRYFAGMTMPQVAETLGISLRTAERNWTYARTWLHRDLR